MAKKKATKKKARTVLEADVNSILEDLWDNLLNNQSDERALFRETCEIFGFKAPLTVSEDEDDN